MASSDVRQKFNTVTRKDKILARIQMASHGCWIWQPKAGTNRYGIYYENGKYYSAHRASYEAFVGPIPKGLVLDHLCEQQYCVNPDHLEPVTQLENVHRSSKGITAINKRKTHCKSGHEFTESNTVKSEYKGRIHRACKECRKKEYPASNARRRLKRQLNKQKELSYGI